MTTDENTTRNTLLLKARELFTERGYQGVSTREIAEAAGVNLGAIQYHFGSKSKLFIETVHSCFEGQECHPKTGALSEAPSSKEDAAVKLSQFIFGILHSVLCSDAPHPSRLMFREIFSPTSQDPEMFEALISSVVNDFIGPSDQRLMEILQIINPKAPKKELELMVHSIIGQCFFYMTHRPFIERLRSEDYSNSAAFEAAATHIVRTTMRGLSCGEEFIRDTLAQAAECCLKPVQQNTRGPKR